MTHKEVEAIANYDMFRSKAVYVFTVIMMGSSERNGGERTLFSGRIKKRKL